MNRYILSNGANEDLIKIYHFGVERFDTSQADKYFENFFDPFGKIAQTRIPVKLLIVSGKTIEDVRVD